MFLGHEEHDVPRTLSFSFGCSTSQGPSVARAVRAASHRHRGLLPPQFPVNELVLNPRGTGRGASGTCRMLFVCGFGTRTSLKPLRHVRPLSVRQDTEPSLFVKVGETRVSIRRTRTSFGVALNLDEIKRPCTSSTLASAERSLDSGPKVDDPQVPKWGSMTHPRSRGVPDEDPLAPSVASRDETPRRCDRLPCLPRSRDSYGLPSLTTPFPDLPCPRRSRSRPPRPPRQMFRNLAVPSRVTFPCTFVSELTPPSHSTPTDLSRRSAFLLGYTPKLFFPFLRVLPSLVHSLFLLPPVPQGPAPRPSTPQTIHRAHDPRLKTRLASSSVTP